MQFADAAATTSFHDREKQHVAGRYRLLELVGQGNFGSVWKAHDLELDRIVSLKLPRAGQLDHLTETLFLREARAAAQLKHPHIVGVHEVGHDQLQIYIVSDFIDGVTLSDWLTKHSLTPQDAARLALVRLSKAA